MIDLHDLKQSFLIFQYVNLEQALMEKLSRHEN